MIHNLKPYVPALVNEALGEHYTDKALVTLKAGKEVQRIMGGYIILNSLPACDYTLTTLGNFSKNIENRINLSL